MPLFNASVDFDKIPSTNVVSERRATPPASPVAGQRYFDTALSQEGFFTGSIWVYVGGGGGGGGVLSVAATAPIASSGGTNPTISITPATGSLAGSMSIGDFTKLGGSTASNTANALVQRDGSGNFSAGTITASAFTGTASNASQLNSQSAAFYQGRANHTGTQLASTISDFDSQVRTSRLDQMASPTAAVGFGGQRVTGLAAPIAGSDAATRTFVESMAATGTNKGAARVVATGNLALAFGSVVDGITLAIGDIVLATAQSVAADNGPYVFNGPSVAMTRATFADISAEVTTGLFMFVSEGSANNASTGYTLVTPAPIVLGTTALTFTQTSGAGQITSGTGLTKTGNVLNVGAGVGILANADDVAVDSSVVLRKTTPVLIGDGTATSFPIVHGYNNLCASSRVVLVSTGRIVIPDEFATSANTLTIVFATAPTTNQYRVQVIG